MLNTPPPFGITAGYNASPMNRQSIAMLGNPGDQYSPTGTPGMPQGASSYSAPSSQLPQAWTGGNPASGVPNPTLPQPPLAGPATAPGMNNPNVLAMVRALQGGQMT